MSWLVKLLTPISTTIKIEKFEWFASDGFLFPGSQGSSAGAGAFVYSPYNDGTKVEDNLFLKLLFAYFFLVQKDIVILLSYFEVPYQS